VSERGHEYRVYLDGGVGQDLNQPAAEPREVTEDRDTPFCLGIVGPFSGSRNPEEDADPHGRARSPLRRVTPENVMELAGLAPALSLSGPEDGVPGPRLHFSHMEDFHPSRLAQRQEIFRSLWKLRSAIEAGEEIKGNGGKEGREDEARDPGPDRAPEGVEESPEAGLLEAVLGETGAPREREARDPEEELDEELDDFVRRVVRPHLVEDTAHRSRALAEVDGRMGRLLEEVLHDPAFQELEALWRSVVFLLSRLQVSTRLRVYLLDVSQEELMGDLLSTDEPTEWGFAHTVLNPISEHGEELRWAALVGAFRFGSHPLHTPLLQRLGLLAEMGQVPWLSGAHSLLLGADSLTTHGEPGDWSAPEDPLWEELRGNPEARWIHLAIPGFLLRGPYGPEGERVRKPDFREETSFPADLLWGNPAVLMGLAMAQRFSQAGWALDMGGRHEISQLPLVQDPGGHLTCVEARLSPNAAAEARERGLNPVISPRNEPRILLEGMRSVAASGGGLQG